MAGTYLPLAALLLATAVALLVATSSSVPVPAAAAAAAAHKYYSGRMVIIRAPGARVVSAGAGGALSKWQQRRRLVEDEVAPELGGLQGAGDPGIGNHALDPNKQVCLPSGQCTKPAGGSYSRGCTYGNYCSH